MGALSDAFGRKVGIRYLRAKKNSSFLSLITMISIGGVAVGVLTLIVTLSVMAGFEGELKKRLFSGETHVLVERATGDVFRADAALLQRIRNAAPDVTSVFPVLQTEAILRSGSKISGAVLKGIGHEQMGWLSSHLTERSGPEFLAGFGDESRIYLGQEMAFEMGVVPGDRVTAVSPVEREGPFGAVPRVKRFAVAGIYRTGIPEQEIHTAFVPISGVESFLRQEGLVSRIEIRLQSLDGAGEAASRIRGALASEASAFDARSWQELNAHLFRSLQLERAAMFSILAFIVVVATFNIVSTLTMAVTEKRRSLSILRAMGATPDQISNVFLWEGLAIGVVGVGAGLVLGLGACWLLARYPFIELPEFYYDRSLPVVVNPYLVALVAIVALAIVLAGSIVPAKRASRISIIEGVADAQ